MKSVLRRRVVQGALMIVALGAGWSTSAAALPPLPPPPITLSLPTVTVPPLTTTLVTTPAVTTTATVSLPPPVPPAPRIPVPAPPAPPAPQSAPQGGETTGAGSAATGESSHNASRVVRGESSREQAASRLGLARDWIARSGTREQRRTTFVFVLRKPAIVELDFLQLAPDCRRIGRIRVRGHRGVNRLPLRTRVGRRLLAPGTYRVVARALPSGRTVGRARLVVVDHASGSVLRAARNADSCAATAGLANGPVSGPHLPPAGARPASGEPRRTARPKRRHGTLGARFSRAALSAADETPVWAYALLALAIALLGGAVLLVRAAPAEFAAALLLALVGSAIILGLTITYALA